MKIRKSLLVAAAMLAISAVPSFANNFGLGYFRPEFPVGGRVWVSEKVAFDAGVGFNTLKTETGSTTNADLSTFGFDLGMPYVVCSTDKAKFFVRPGFSYATGKDKVANTDVTAFWVSGSLGAEYFLSDNFSIQAAHGLRYTSQENKTGATKVKTKTFSSEAFGLSSIGFHYYFGGK
jgi:hypothetical protein